MEDIYQVNPTFLFSQRDGVTRVVSLEESNNELIKLTGAAAEILHLFDGKRSTSEVQKQLHEKLGRQGSDQDFQKLINFLEEKEIIKKV